MNPQPWRDALAERTTEISVVPPLAFGARASALSRVRTTARRLRGERKSADWTSAAKHRRGGVLVEFAFIALAFYLLLAGTLEVGRMVFGLQTLQAASRVGARELAQIELPAVSTFEEALANPEVRASVYDPGRLVIDVTGLNDAAYQQLVDALPSVNRMLLPLMIRERMDLGGGERDYLRYPGAVMRVVNPAPGESLYTVAIPRVLSRASTGAEEIDWVPVVEEVRPSANPAEAPFSVVSTGRQRGLVCLRINYPYQAATLSAYRVTTNPDGSVVNTPIEASDDGVVQAAAPPAGLTLANPTSDPSANSGRYGMGEHYALNLTLRPYRRLLSAQSMFRREVFSR